MDQNLLDSPIEYLKGVGPTKGDMLKKELGIFTFGDLLTHFPYRYVDKTKFHRIREIGPESGSIQLKGILRRLSTVGEGRKRRLVGNKVSHANNKTKMKQQVNLHTKRVYDPESGETIKLRLSAKAIRTLDKVGSLSKFVRKYSHLIP